jgi:hypothetical protein
MHPMTGLVCGGERLRTIQDPMQIQVIVNGEKLLVLMLCTTIGCWGSTDRKTGLAQRR